MSPGPDVTGEYILNSSEDPCYENIAALGAEYIGWSLVANEEAGSLGSIYLEADGTSRQPKKNPQAEWAPDLEGRLFDPQTIFHSRRRSATRIGMTIASARCWAVIFRLQIRQCGMRSTAADMS
jgi:hypothetical protein